MHFFGIGVNKVFSCEVINGKVMHKTLNTFFGLCSLLGLVFTLYTLVSTLNEIKLLSKENVVIANLASIYQTLSWTILALIIIFLIQSYLFNSNISKLQHQLGELPLENKHLVDVNEYQTEIINHYIRVTRSTTDSIHNITHYYRYITILLRDTVIDLRKNNSVTDNNQCRKICNEFEKFMFSLLSSTTSTLEVITQDECSTCIKLINNNKIKTFYRDSNSYRNRRDSDYTAFGQVFVYDVIDNFAFNLIADPNAKETFFVCDNLKEFKDYYNRNFDWNKLYNATFVVPIQANLSGNKRKKEMHILGFLCCDNMIGNLENQEVKDFLSSIGDLLYNLFIFYDRFYLLSNDKGLSNETLQNYGHWGDSGQIGS